MKTAAELCKIAETSQVNIDRLVDELEPILLRAAEEGLRSVKCYFKIFDVSFWETESEYRIDVEPSTILKSVMKRLKQSDLAFRVQWGPDGSSYVPRGLEEYGEGEKCVNWVLTIFW